jgi:hypothetical protein
MLFKRLCLAVFCLVSGWSLPVLPEARAQEALVRDDATTEALSGTGAANLSAVSRKQAQADEPLTPRTLPLPFRDFFTVKRLSPDTVRWFRASSVYIARTGSGNPPDLGTVVFDGRTSRNIGYSTALILSGFADSLVSHNFDLSATTPADSVYLSFYVQPAGLGDEPEPADSMTLWFWARYVKITADTLFKGTDSMQVKLDTTVTQRYEQVWALEGSPLKPFQRVMVAVVDSQYLHSGFHFKFANRATLNGAYDLWHLDQVELAANRSRNDPPPPDLALQTLPRSPFRGLTHSPMRHIGVAVPEDTLRYAIRSSVRQDLACATGFNLFDAQTNTVLTQRQTTAGFTTADSLLDIRVPQPTFTPVTSAPFSRYRLTAGLVVPNAVDDTYPDNNQAFNELDFADYLAQDDGEAEAGYGLRDTRAFGQVFELAAPDSLYAVDLAFMPRSEIFPGDRFEIAIWDYNKLIPDSFIYKRSLFLALGLTPNYFTRFPLRDTVPLPPKFMLGIIQVTNRLLGVGYDLDFNNNRRVYWDSLGTFVTSRLNGTLCLRPVLTGGEPATARHQARNPQTVALYPNPLTRGGDFQLRLPTGQRVRTVRFLDLTGRQVLELPASPAQAVFRVPETLPPSLYFVDIQLDSGESLPVQRVVIH